MISDHNDNIPASEKIQIKNVTKVYNNKVKALDNISFTIKKGEIFGLLGPNGAGKSTLINIIAGVQRKNSGILKVWDYDLDKELIEIKRRVGTVPQEISFDGFFTVHELLKIHSGYYGILNNEEHIENLLKVFHLWDKKDSNSRHLSGGMRRRLLITKALVHKPSFLILDEPTAGVDVQLRNSLWEYIRELNKNGTTILLTTHYLYEAEDLCDRIAIIDKGKLIALDTIDNLKNNFATTQTVHLYLNEHLPEDFYKNTDYKFVYDKDCKKLSLNVKVNDYNKLIKTIYESGLSIKKIDVQNISLEKIFLEMTKNEND